MTDKDTAPVADEAEPWKTLTEVARKAVKRYEDSYPHEIMQHVRELLVLLAGAPILVEQQHRAALAAEYKRGMERAAEIADEAERDGVRAFAAAARIRVAALAEQPEKSE